MDGNTVIGIVAVATFVEVLVEVLKPMLDPIFQRLSWLPADANPYLYISVLGGIVAAAIYGFDLLAALEIAEWTLFGMVGTGMVIGRGANFVHDIIALIGAGVARGRQ